MDLAPIAYGLVALTIFISLMILIKIHERNSPEPRTHRSTYRK